MFWVFQVRFLSFLLLSQCLGSRILYSLYRSKEPTSTLAQSINCRRGIARHLLKNVLNLSVCIKITFLLQFPFFIWCIPLVDIIGIKPTPATTNPTLRKWVQYQVNQHKYTEFHSETILTKIYKTKSTTFFKRDLRFSKISWHF